MNATEAAARAAVLISGSQPSVAELHTLLWSLVELARAEGAQAGVAQASAALGTMLAIEKAAR